MFGTIVVVILVVAVVAIIGGGLIYRNNKAKIDAGVKKVSDVVDAVKTEAKK
jgi:hypothetical protein